MVIGPFRAAGYDLCCTILSREVRERPNGIELRLKVREMFTPRPFIAMNRLRRFARADTDDLS